QTVAPQPPDCHGHSWRGYLKPAGKGGGDDGFPFAFGFRDGLQVIFLGNGNTHSLVIVICAGEENAQPRAKVSDIRSNFCWNSAGSPLAGRSITPAIAPKGTFRATPSSCTG